MNEEIRALAGRLEIAKEGHAFSWMCACGCFTIVTATTSDYDAAAGQVLAAGHPADAERAAATQAFEHEPDPSAVARRVDEQRRRELTNELARRLEREVMANNG